MLLVLAQVRVEYEEWFGKTPILFGEAGQHGRRSVKGMRVWVHQGG